MSKILLIEDDIYLEKNMRLMLEKGGYEVSVASTVAGAKHHMEQFNADMYLIDIMLPDGNGFELCQYIREDSQKPIIIISAKDDEDSIVKGLEIGADDYVTKPFKPNELLSRIKANLRRIDFKNNCKIYMRMRLHKMQ